MSQSRFVPRKNGQLRRAAGQALAPSFQALESRLLLDAVPVITVDYLATNNIVPVLTGSVDDPLAAVQVSVNGTLYDAVNDGHGGWHTSGAIDPLPDTNAMYDVIATATSGSLVGTDATTDELLIDLIRPGSGITSISPYQSTHKIELTWAGQDNPDGSGIAFYDIYVSIDGGAAQPALSNIADTRGIYTGLPGHVYSFFSIASDAAGNQQSTLADAMDTTLWATQPTVLSALTGRTANFLDSNATPVTVKYSGPGMATIFQTSDPDTGLGDITDITVDGGTTSSGLTFTAADPGTVIGNITVNGSISYITGSLVDLEGSITVTGVAKKITLRDVLGPQTITILGTGSASAALKFNIADDLTVNSGIRIASAYAADWRNTDGIADMITAPKLGKLTVPGSAGVGLSLGAGQSQKSTALSSVKIGGDWTAGTIDINGKVGTINVAGWFSDTQLSATNSISTIKVGGLQNADIFAGLQAGSTGFSASPVVFNPLTPSTIKSLTVTGAVQDIDGYSMIDSNISASKVSSAKFIFVKFDNSGDAFGISTLKLSSLKYYIGASLIKWTPATGDIQDFNILVV